jgi:hypothetical protein
MRIDILKKLKKAPKRAGYLFLALLVALTGLIWWHPSRAHAQTDTFTTSGSWTVPAGVSSAVFEAWGGGGAGGAGSTNGTGGGGGAGGQYAKTTLTGLVSSNAYPVTVSTTTAGGAGNGSAGGDSGVTSPSSSQVVLAKGGAGGATTNGSLFPSGGFGSTTGGVGDFVFAGGSGSGGSTSSATSGAGAGGAGSGGNGGDAAGATAGTGTAANGGTGGAGVTGNAAGLAGNNYGGGGGGASKSGGTTKNGGTGAQGLVTVTYTAANTPPSVPTLTLPGPGTIGIHSNNTFTLRSSDADNDYLQYEIQVCSNSSCSSVVRTVCQFTDAATGCTASQTGWSGQNQPSCPTTCTAYTGNSSIISSSFGQYTYQTPLLSLGTQYWWRAWAIDPAGSNTISSPTAISGFTTDSSPDAPTLITPASGAAGIATTPSFTLRTTDFDSDDLDYRIYLYQSDCSTPVGSSPFAQTSSQTGWSGQDANAGAAYVGSPTLTSSTIATYTYQGALANNTQYCWTADAVDSGGSNTYSSISATQLFTTLATPPAVTIGGGVNINGGSTIQ